MLWPTKLTLTILMFGGFLLLADLVPQFRMYKAMDWQTVPKVLEFVDRGPAMSPETEQLRLRPETDALKQAKHPILDATHNLDTFYKALHRAEGQKGTVRILHYGDSPTTADLITADVRALLQKQFGDAGHGFCLIAKPWAWYEHRGMDIRGDGWRIDPINQASVRDGLFGLGGVSFRAEPGAVASIRAKTEHTRIEVAYLKQPGGGQFRVEAEGVLMGTVSTDAPQTISGFAGFPIPVESRTYKITPLGGPVRLFGVRLERDAPGVIYNSLGVNGASVTVLARTISESHWREQLQHYQPDLVIINYGTNESVYPAFVDNVSGKEMKELIRRLRSALPDTSLLLMSPMDRGERTTGGIIGTVPTIPRLVAIQQRVAQENSAAFFNTFAAMGGDGTMGRWYEAEPRMVGADFIHPMPGGAKIVGGLLYQALLDGYNKYKLRLLKNKPMVALNP